MVKFRRTSGRVKLRPAALMAVAAVCGFLLATTMAAVASTNVSVSPRDNCGGFNGHVVWSAGSGSYIQVYGEVWQNQCSSGTTSVWLSWDSPSYHNIQAEAAGASQTKGVNYKTSTAATPGNMKVTVCSQSGGWHCGTPVSVPTRSTTTTGKSTTTAPVVTTPVTVTVPQPTPRPRALRVTIALSWTYDRAVTQLKRVKIGRFPVGTRLVVRCSGHGCPSPARATATGRRGVHRLLRGLRGRRYRAGDRLLMSLQSPGWTSERVRIEIRNSQIPKVELLRRRG